MITAKTYKSKLPIQANSCLRERRLFLWVKGTWKMNVKKRIEKESFAIPLMMKGCPRWKVNMWYKRMERDRRLHEKDYIPGVLAYWHERGYLSSSIKRWGLTGKTKTDRISDFEYLYISPFNNTFSKWLEDMLTTQRVMHPDGKHFRTVYFSIIQREKKQLILRVGQEDRLYTIEDVLALVREKGAVELRPAYWNSKGKRYLLAWAEDAESGEYGFFCNGEAAAPESIEETIDGLKTSYVLADPVSITLDFSDPDETPTETHVEVEIPAASAEPAVEADESADAEADEDAAEEPAEEPEEQSGNASAASEAAVSKVFDHALKFWIANDAGDEPQILYAEITIYYDVPRSADAPDEMVRKSLIIPVNRPDGTFRFNGKYIKIPGWEALTEELRRDAALIPQISYYWISVALQPDGDYTYLRFSGSPSLPKDSFGDLNRYLKERYEDKLKESPLEDNSPEKLVQFAQNKLRSIQTKTFSRKGMRPYMYQLWRSSAWDDLLHTKGVSLPQKLWAHSHGFFSWHLYQYGITKTNYQQFLSDYDYYWLNRINNGYQKWVNDKTTYRFLMEPFKEYVPQYYFSVFKRGEKTVICKMPDCPADIPEGFDGLLTMLRKMGKLAFKASAGTHGDGFYCLSYENGLILSNGKPCGTSGLHKLLDEIQSFYIITEYLEMHRELKKIYDKSVNTVRVMVVNDHGYDPRILQTYMRIGSSKTGYTDNVGYGGICVFVNKETGELYQPETIKDHVFYDCPVHPDTGTPIAGFLPHWDLVRTKILEICRYFCELEYLGFDVAITDAGFQILEINIHQDLHKVATYDEDIKDFFRRKMELKRAYYASKPRH